MPSAGAPSETSFAPQSRAGTDTRGACSACWPRLKERRGGRTTACPSMHEVLHALERRRVAECGSQIHGVKPDPTLRAGPVPRHWQHSPGGAGLRPRQLMLAADTSLVSTAAPAAEGGTVRRKFSCAAQNRQIFRHTGRESRGNLGKLLEESPGEMLSERQGKRQCLDHPTITAVEAVPSAFRVCC